MQDEIRAGRTVLSRIPDGSEMRSVQLVRDTAKPDVGMVMINYEPIPAPAPTTRGILEAAKRTVDVPCQTAVERAVRDAILRIVDAALAADK